MTRQEPASPPPIPPMTKIAHQLQDIAAPLSVLFRWLPSLLLSLSMLLSPAHCLDDRGRGHLVAQSARCTLGRHGKSGARPGRTGVAAVMDPPAVLGGNRVGDGVDATAPPKARRGHRRCRPPCEIAVSEGSDSGNGNINGGDNVGCRAGTETRRPSCARACGGAADEKQARVGSRLFRGGVEEFADECLFWTNSHLSRAQEHSVTDVKPNQS